MSSEAALRKLPEIAIYECYAGEDKQCELRFLENIISRRYSSNENSDHPVLG